MGLLFTLLFIFAAYMGPEVLFGDLAQYHVQIVIAVLTMFCSLLSLQDSDLLGLPQTFGVLGLLVVVPLSVIFSGWFGGAPTALMEFLPNAMVFFFIVLNCKKKSHLQMLIAILLFTAIWNVSQGLRAEWMGNDASPYLITMKNSANENFYRIRAVDFLNDPNDLAQFILMLLPCLFFFWEKGKTVRNVLFVLLPASFLLAGIFFTHSRGAMVALMVAAMIAGRRKFGLGRSLIAGLILYIAMSAAGFSGGRSSSMEDGEDRMDSWAAGLTMIRTHPLFGVGFNRFTDVYSERPAHNSVILGAAETGLIGLFFWMVINVTTVRDSYVGSGPIPSAEITADEKRRRKIVLRRSDANSISGRETALSFSPEPKPKENRVLQPPLATGFSPMHLPAPAFKGPRHLTAPQKYVGDPRVGSVELPKADVYRMSNLMLISVGGFLTAGWFLPRTYTMTMFVEAAIAAVIYRIGRQQQIVPAPMPFAKIAKFAALAEVASVGLVWIFLRLSHL